MNPTRGRASTMTLKRFLTVTSFTALGVILAAAPLIVRAQTTKPAAKPPAHAPAKPTVKAPAKPPIAGSALDRTILPIPEPAVPFVTELDARKVTPPPRFEVKAPQGAPNVLIVLIDDMGFGQSSAFGGPIQMPTLDRLAAGG